MYLKLLIVLLLLILVLLIQGFNSGGKEINPIDYIGRIEPKIYKKQPDIIGKKISASGGALKNNISRDLDGDAEELETFVQRPINPQEQMANTIRDSINRNYMFEGDPNLGDMKLFSKMHDLGQNPKRALDSRMKYDKNSLIPYVERELMDASNSVWWDNDGLEQFL